MARGLTFDTGALIGLERRRHRMRKVLDVAERDGVTITVPAVVVAEWWRRASSAADGILAMVTVEPMDKGLAKVAGEALAAIGRAGVVDAIVMASAARRGDVVYTSDVEDLERLRAHFRAVARVLAA
jgi:predicted nucleic acid-binding protein